MREIGHQVRHHRRIACLPVTTIIAIIIITIISSPSGHHATTHAATRPPPPPRHTQHTRQPPCRPASAPSPPPTTIAHSITPPWQRHRSQPTCPGILGRLSHIGFGSCFWCSSSTALLWGSTHAMQFFLLSYSCVQYNANVHAPSSMAGHHFIWASLQEGHSGAGVGWAVRSGGWLLLAGVAVRLPACFSCLGTTSKEGVHAKCLSPVCSQTCPSLLPPRLSRPPHFLPP